MTHKDGNTIQLVHWPKKLKAKSKPKLIQVHIQRNHMLSSSPSLAVHQCGDNLQRCHIPLNFELGQWVEWNSDFASISLSWSSLWNHKLRRCFSCDGSICTVHLELMTDSLYHYFAQVYFLIPWKSNVVKLLAYTRIHNSSTYRVQYLNCCWKLQATNDIQKRNSKQ